MSLTDMRHKITFAFEDLWHRCHEGIWDMCHRSHSHRTCKAILTLTIIERNEEILAVEWSNGRWCMMWRQ